MDDRTFDRLTKLFAYRLNRRSVLRSLLGLGGAAAGSQLAPEETEAALPGFSQSFSSLLGCSFGRVLCNGRCCPLDQICCGTTCCASADCAGGATCCTGLTEPCGTTCIDITSLKCCAGQICQLTDACTNGMPSHCCAAPGTACGPECCPQGSECCGHECCPVGQACFAEELCCVAEQVCQFQGGIACCSPDQVCCDVDGCCDGVCFGGVDSDDFCCTGELCAPNLCCEPDERCCSATIAAPFCIPDVANACCDSSDCTGLSDPPNCIAGICNTDTHLCEAVDFCALDGQGGTCCPSGQPAIQGKCCPANQICCDPGTLQNVCLSLEAGACCTDADCTNPPPNIGPCFDAICDDQICIYFEDQFSFPCPSGSENPVCCPRARFDRCCQGAAAECCGFDSFSGRTRECDFNGQCCAPETPFHCPDSGTGQEGCCDSECCNGVCCAAGQVCCPDPEGETESCVIATSCTAVTTTTSAPTGTTTTPACLPNQGPSSPCTANAQCCSNCCNRSTNFCTNGNCMEEPLTATTATEGSEETVPNCVPGTCAGLGLTCGTAEDGCGGRLDCGECPQEPCVPIGCAELGVVCGPAVDNCGTAIDCGPCAEPAPACLGNLAACSADTECCSGCCLDGVGRCVRAEICTYMGNTA